MKPFFKFEGRLRGLTTLDWRPVYASVFRKTLCIKTREVGDVSVLPRDPLTLSTTLRGVEEVHQRAGERDR